MAPYTKSNALCVGGSECAVHDFLNIIRRWIDIELWFSEDNSYADALNKLRKSKKEDYGEVLAVCRNHAGLESINNIVFSIIDLITDALRVDLATIKSAPLGWRISPVTLAHSLGDEIPSVFDIGAMGGGTIHIAVVFKARKIFKI